MICTFFGKRKQGVIDFGARFSLSVLVVAVGGDDVYMHFGVEDFINEPMLLCDAATPLSSAITRERLRFSGASAGMIH